MQTSPMSRPFRFARAFGLMTLALVSCSRTSPTTVDSQQVRQEIDRINDRTSQWWDAGLSDSIAGTYAEDATMLEQNEAPAMSFAWPTRSPLRKDTLSLMCGESIPLIASRTIP